MVQDPLSSPIQVDGVSREKVAQLLAEGAEYSELDYKRKIDLTTKAGLIELAKDVAAMQVKGGYILGGADNQGNLTGEHDGETTNVFDEANLVPKLLTYLSRPLNLSTNTVEIQGHTVIAICVYPNPDGCAFFETDGAYEKAGHEKVVFRANDVFWRDGTRSVRISRDGLKEVIDRRVAARKDAWHEEQAEIRRRERGELEAAFEDRRRAQGALGSVSFSLDTQEMTASALELARAGDSIALQHLIGDGFARARRLIETGDVGDELNDVLDKLSCLASTFSYYEQNEWFVRVIQALVKLYDVAFADKDPKQFGYATHIPPAELGPRVWLAIIERVYAIGALATRHDQWSAVRTLTLQLPDLLRQDGYEVTWLRHALTMAGRAQHFSPDLDTKLDLLSFARADAARLGCLRPDGLGADDELLLTSLAQFDILSNVVAIAGAGSTDTKVFYTNFAHFDQARVQPIIERLISDTEMREALTPGFSDEDLAVALQRIGNLGAQEAHFASFYGWDGTNVGRFVQEHLPGPAS